MTLALGTVGIWTGALDGLPVAAAVEAAVELEELGYGTVWLPESFGREPFVQAALLLGATSRLTLATGIASIYARDATTANAAARTLVAAFPDRFLLGLGVSHAPAVEGLRGHVYEKPLAAMEAYLDGLDAAMFRAVGPAGRPPRVLAALGPKMLELARDKADGAHPYLVTPAQTATTRAALGPDKLIGVEQAVALTTDPSVARARGRTHLKIYLSLPNYRNSWLRQGFTEADLADGGSDRLVDALVGWGDEAAVVARVAEHRSAGADHVCVQVLGDDQRVPPLADWRTLAPALGAVA